MDLISTELLAVAVFASLIAAFIHGSIGFGYAMVVTPLLALVTNLQTAILLTLVPTLLVNLISIASEGRVLLAFRRFLPLGLLAMVGAAIGTSLLLVSDSEVFKLILAGAIIVYLTADRLRLDLGWIRDCPIPSLVLFGLVAGVLAGLTNVMAPVLIIYSLESGHSRSELIQASNVCFFTGKLAQVVLFIIYDRFSMGQLPTTGLMIVALLLSLFIGVRLRKAINVEIYARIIRSFLLLLAVMLSVQVLV